ncbi:MAG: hypothetical protein M0Z50_19130 [Planctomycetia bacterium]|nr:hypothetical protein [Planctomycetia bacterium]
MDLRLTATVAPYLETIRAHRLAGWRWRDIRAVLKLTCTDHALARAVRRCKWEAEQLPLPTTQPVSKTAASSSAPRRMPGLIGASGSNEQSEIDEYNRRFSISSNKGELK